MNSKSFTFRFSLLLAAVVFAVSLTGCIADTAEDSDLPWATDQGWEGMIPLPVGASHNYD